MDFVIPKYAKKISTKTGFILISSVLILFYLFFSSQIVVLDDGFYYQRFAERLINDHTIVAESNAFHGLSFFAALVYLVTGSSNSIALTGIIFAILNIPMIYLTTKSFFDEEAGRISVILYMLSPLLYIVPLRGLTESGLVFFVLLMLYLVKKESKLSILSFIMACAIKPFAICLIPFLLAQFYRPIRKENARYHLTIISIAAVGGIILFLLFRVVYDVNISFWLSGIFGFNKFFGKWYLYFIRGLFSTAQSSTNWSMLYPSPIVTFIACYMLLYPRTIFCRITFLSSTLIAILSLNTVFWIDWRFAAPLAILFIILASDFLKDHKMVLLLIFISAYPSFVYADEAYSNMFWEQSGDILILVWRLMFLAVILADIKGINRRINYGINKIASDKLDFSKVRILLFSLIIIAAIAVAGMKTYNVTLNEGDTICEIKGDPVWFKIKNDSNSKNRNTFMGMPLIYSYGSVSSNSFQPNCAIQEYKGYALVNMTGYDSFYVEARVYTQEEYVLLREIALTNTNTGSEIAVFTDKKSTSRVLLNDTILLSDFFKGSGSGYKINRIVDGYVVLYDAKISEVYGLYAVSGDKTRTRYSSYFNDNPPNEHFGVQYISTTGTWEPGDVINEIAVFRLPLDITELYMTSDGIKKGLKYDEASWVSFFSIGLLKSDYVTVIIRYNDSVVDGSKLRITTFSNESTTINLPVDNGNGEGVWYSTDIKPFNELGRITNLTVSLGGSGPHDELLDVYVVPTGYMRSQIKEYIDDNMQFNPAKYIINIPFLGSRRL